MAAIDALAASNKMWPRSTSLFLALVGVVLSLVSFLVVLNMPELRWDDARDARLRDTFETFQSTGALLLAPASSASGDGAMGAWIDDPGVYLLASLMGGITGSTSPYPGLGLVMAVLVALPLLWLPTAVARIFRRARAGYALVLLPAVVWLVNQGTILVGTEYGLSDSVSTIRVFALYGVPASLAFLSLSLLLLFSTYRLGMPTLVAVSVLIVVLAGLGNLAKAYSGLGPAIAVGVLWWLNSTDRWRWIRGLSASLVAVLLSLGLQLGFQTAVGAAQSDPASAGVSVSATPKQWHALYLGLAYPEPVGEGESVFGVKWSDGFVQGQVSEANAEVAPGTDAYGAIVRDLYFDQVNAEPGAALGLYLAKALSVIKHFGAMIAFILVAFIIALMRRSPQRRLMRASLAIALPTLLLGLLSPILVAPALYYFSELAAALGLLVAVSLGALVWSLTSMPSHVRATERNRLSSRLPQRFSPQDVRSHTSAIIPTRNGEAVIADTARALGRELKAGDEVIVVENGSTDGTTRVLEELSADWSYDCELVVIHSGPGLGEALRTGVLASTGQWLLLSADDLPFGFSDYNQFKLLPGDVIVAVGSKAHPDSDVVRSRRRMIQSRVFRFLRAALLQSRVGDSQGTIWVDGDWARSFAMLSREMGLMWTTELVLAAEQQGIAVREVPVSLSDAHETGSSRFRFADAWQSVVGFIRLAVYKDDYANEVWTRSTAVEPMAERL